MEELDELLTCAVCLDLYISPRRLPCLHVYCIECLRGLRHKITSILNCPECRAEHVIPNVDKIPIDYRIIKFVEIQKNLSTSIKSSDELEAAGCSRAVGIKEDNSAAKAEDEKVRLLESTIVRECRELFTQISQQETKDIILQQKVLLKQKQMVISITRKNIDIATDEAKKELDKRRDDLNHQLDQQAEKIDAALKKFDYMNTVSEDVTFYRNILFEKSSYSDMLSIHALLEESKQKVNNLMHVGTQYNALNSVKFEKTFSELNYAIHQFGELVEMEKYHFNLETESLKSNTEAKVDYNNKWDIMKVTKMGLKSYPGKIKVNAHNGNVYVTSARGVVEYDLKGKIVNMYETMNRTCGITFDQDGRMIVNTRRISHNAVVLFYNSQGRQMRQFSISGAGNKRGILFFSTDVASDSESRLYFTDPTNTEQIQVLNNDGTFICSIEDIKEMTCPGSLCIDDKKTNDEYPRLFVSDEKLHKVLVFDVKGDKCDFVKEMSVNKPSDICLDMNGNLLVASNADKSITVLDKNGDRMACISEPAEALKDIGGIAITDSGVLCVTSWEDGKVYFLHSS